MYGVGLDSLVCNPAVTQDSTLSRGSALVVLMHCGHHIEIISVLTFKFVVCK